MAEEKKKRKAYEAPDEKGFEKLVDTLIDQFEAYVKALFANKKHTEFPEDAPTSSELSGWIKQLRHDLTKQYNKLYKQKVQKPKQKQGEDRGFKTPRYAAPTLVKFVNDHCALPKELYLEPIMSNGNAIFTCAQGTSILTDYIERKGLKDKEKKSVIVPDDPLDDLFKPLYGFIKKNKKQEIDGKTCFNHATLQSLISKLFIPQLSVLECKYTPKQRTLLKSREEWLAERTSQNKAKREAAKEEDKKRRAAEREAAKIAAKIV